MTTMQRVDDLAMKAAIALALAALVAATAFAGGRAVVPEGTDVRAVLGELREAQAPEIPAIGAMASAPQTSKDCGAVTFRYGESADSAPLALRSHMFIRVCREYYGRERCWDEHLGAVERSVVISLRGARATLPWEVDSFVACLEGEKVTVEAVKASHDYKLEHKPGATYTVVATAKRKLVTDPDPAGILVDSFGQNDAGTVVLLLKDRWAAFYKGEKTALKVKLRRETPHWFDSTLVEAELEVAPADAYAVDFNKLSLQLPWRQVRIWAKPGDKLYVEWEFARNGKVSRGTFQNGGATPRIVYNGQVH